jgi:hypothetical protein
MLIMSTAGPETVDKARIERDLRLVLGREDMFLVRNIYSTTEGVSIATFSGRYIKVQAGLWSKADLAYARECCGLRDPDKPAPVDDAERAIYDRNFAIELHISLQERKINELEKQLEEQVARHRYRDSPLGTSERT